MSSEQLGLTRRDFLNSLGRVLFPGPESQIAETAPVQNQPEELHTKSPSAISMLEPTAAVITTRPTDIEHKGGDENSVKRSEGLNYLIVKA